MYDGRNDAEFLEWIRTRLTAPLVGDILDRLGRFHQFLPQPIRPLRADMRVCGRAMPVQIVDVEGPQAKPFGRLTEALDQLRPGEVWVAAGGTLRCAGWGEILTATARRRGAAGAVLDGFHRDTPKVLGMDWPVFSRGSYAQDAGVRAAVAAYRCPLRLGDVDLLPGDLVFGDPDGVVVVPRDLEVEVVRLAFEKAEGEKVVRRAIEAGMTSTEAFRRHGIL